MKHDLNTSQRSDQQFRVIDITFLPFDLTFAEIQIAPLSCA